MMRHSYTHIVLQDVGGPAGRSNRIARFPGSGASSSMGRRARWG